MNYWPTWSDLIFFVGYALAIKYFDKAMTWTRWVASVAFVYAAPLVARRVGGLWFSSWCCVSVC
jgi:hypothetical protein